MSTFRLRIGGDGPVVAELDQAGWRLIVRRELRARGADNDGLHEALRQLALSDRDLAPDAFRVVMNCAGSWEDEYTEEHGVEALEFDDWIERIEYGGVTWIDDDGELRTTVRSD